MDRRSAARLLGSLIGLGGIAFSITLLSQSMRAVQAIGGSCASGNTSFQIAHQCPNGVGWTFPLAIVGGLAFLGLFAACAGDLGRRVACLAWPALFLTMGWNFLDYGLHPGNGQGTSIGFLVSAVVFVLMGGIPLVFIVAMLFKDLTSPEPTEPPAPVTSWGTNVGFNAPPSATAAPARVVTTPRPTPRAGGDIASELERLASLHGRGDLTDTEYEAAKRQALKTSGGN